MTKDGLGHSQHSSAPKESVKPLSISLKSKFKPTTATARINKVPNGKTPLTASTTKRPRTAFHDDEHEETETSHPEPLLVSEFAEGQAVGVTPEQTKSALVIPKQKNRDWREESQRKRGRNILPREVIEAQKNGGAFLDKEKEVLSTGVLAYGLNTVKRDEDGTRAVEGDHAASTGAPVEPPRPKTDDELALEALTSDGTTRKSNLVLAAPEADHNIFEGRKCVIGVSEEDAFKADVLSRPDSASIDQYAAVPVEEFGAALLRGMGWKEGSAVGKRRNLEPSPLNKNGVKGQEKKSWDVQKRPNLLGIGAKEVPGGVGDELGAWGKTAKGQRKQDKTYNPVVLKNAKTGEMLTEAELKTKVDEEKKRLEDEDWRSRREKNLRVDKEEKRRRGDREGSRERDRHNDRDRDRRREENRDYDSSRHSSSRRERSRSTDGRHRRRREEDGTREKDRSRDKDRSRRDRLEDDRYDSSSSRRRDRERERLDDSDGRQRHGR